MRTYAEPSPPKNNRQTKVDPLDVGIRDATGNHGRAIHDTIKFTNDLGIENSSARVLPKDTVCLSRTASVGYVVVMGRPMSTSQDFVNWICSDKLNPHFLKYVLLAEREALLMFAVGSVHQTIYFPEAKAFHICMPDRNTQDSIVEVLGALDDKIELNRRMNETLELTSRAIFKDWFVDFGPTRAKMDGRAPYLASDIWSLFPNALDEGAKPEGWSVKPLDQVADFLNGLALQKYPANGDDSLPVIKIAQLRAASAASADLASTEIPKDYVVENGDVLFSWSGSLLHRVWTAGRGALNQHLFKVTSKQFPKWFFFHWIGEHMPSFQATAASKATTMGHIQRHHLTQAATVIATPAVMKAADELVEPLFSRQIANDLESRTLAATRDLLLPKLISGEVRVRDAENLVGDAT
ncbi:MAG: restriction endonuclease subunit S [Xanthobacteraceae bacterium]